MNGKIKQRTQSQRDLVGLADHIAQRNLDAADRFLDAYEESLQDLLRMPHLGSRWETDNPRYQDLRWWGVKGFPNHLIFYRPIADGIEVIRVLHAARDLGGLFGGG